MAGRDPRGGRQHLRAVVPLPDGGGARADEARHVVRLYGGDALGVPPHPGCDDDSARDRAGGWHHHVSRHCWRRPVALLQLLRGVPRGAALQDPQGARAAQQRRDQGGDRALHVLNRRHPRARIALFILCRPGRLRLFRGWNHGHRGEQQEVLRLYRLLVWVRGVFRDAWVRGGPPPRLPRAGCCVLPAGCVRDIIRKAIVVRKPPRAADRVHRKLVPCDPSPARACVRTPVAFQRQDAAEGALPPRPLAVHRDRRGLDGAAGALHCSAGAAEGQRDGVSHKVYQWVHAGRAGLGARRSVAGQVRLRLGGSSQLQSLLSRLGVHPAGCQYKEAY
mmetsp:Transcript_29852/g.69751  ORF Transcript_29852/g.69751 Transcript_29852/m.69751 type:complete len:334 (-) Transcript_29852:2717-3718(-)